MLTDTALDKFRAFVKRNIYRARYRIGSTWRDAAINEVEIQSGVDFSKPGTYEVYYYLASDTGSSGRAKGIVVIQ